MTVSITIGAESWTPNGWRTYSMSGESGTRVHPIIGRSNPDVTLGPGTLSSVTLAPVFYGPTAEDDSLSLYLAIRAGGVFVLSSDSPESIAMSFVVYGQFTRALDDETRKTWSVTFTAQEVDPV